MKLFSFSKPGWGSLDLELDTETKQVYKSSLPELIPFRIEGLDNKSDELLNSFCLFEWQNIQYTYLIEETSKFRAPFELRINNRVVKKSKLRNGNNLLTGNFSFDDQVGDTKIEIKDADDQLIFKMETEVFPQKMDYKSDYKAMIADISSIIHNLAYSSLKDTFRKSKPKLTGHTTEHEWWNILNVLFNQLILNLNVIKRQPKHEIRLKEQILPIDKIKQISKKNVNWFQKNGQYSNESGKGINISGDTYFTNALSIQKYVTYDTYENRFIVWSVRNIIEQLRKYKKHIELSQGNLNFTPLLNRMKNCQSRLQGILHTNPFDEVGDFEKRSHFSTSLTRGAGYKDFMQIYLLLSRGLEIANNEIFKIEQKNISTLYEYWCFLKLVQLIKEQSGNEIEYQDLIKIKAGKFKVELIKGKQSIVTFKKPKTEEYTTIYFNREFSRKSRKVFTYNQKPDYTIKFKKKGFEQPFWYLFDAKYRFEEKNIGLDGISKKNDYENYNTEKKENKFNVPQDAIGQLHRYRDAILHTEPTNSTYRAAIKNLGGIILYPYPLSEDIFKSENIYYNSLNDINIGAMPFLPSKTNLVSELLNNLINKRTPEEHFEQIVEMDRSEYENKRNLWKEWVTIGVLEKNNQNERIKFLLEKLMYHIPFVADSNSKLYMSKKLLVCKSGTTDAYLCDVKNWEILTKEELNSIGTKWEHRHTRYVVFKIEKIQKISTPEMIAPIKYRYATREGLNRYLLNVQKNRNYFYLTSPDSARLYEELKNIDIDFNIEWGNIASDPSSIIFNVKGIKIISSELFQNLHFKVDNENLYLNKLLEKIIH